MMYSGSIQDRLALHMADHILCDHFISKKAMATQLNIPYRSLLRLYQGKQSEHDVLLIFDGIARYCLKEHIPPVELFHGFCTK